jgi:hypothetical protein
LKRRKQRKSKREAQDRQFFYGFLYLELHFTAYTQLQPHPNIPSTLQIPESGCHQTEPCSDKLETFWDDRSHKVLIYIEHHSVCPLVGIRDSPTPLAASECALPPRPKGGGAHSPAAKGVGESQFQRLEKRLALCLLCDRSHGLRNYKDTEP